MYIGGKVVRLTVDDLALISCEGNKNMDIPLVKHFNYNTGTSGNPVCRTEDNVKSLGRMHKSGLCANVLLLTNCFFLRLLLLFLSRTAWRFHVHPNINKNCQIHTQLKHCYIGKLNLH